MVVYKSIKKISLLVFISSFVFSCSSCDDQEKDNIMGLEIIWKTPIPEGSFAATRPAANETAVLFVGENGNMHGFDIGSGRKLWETTNTLGYPPPNAIITDGTDFYYDFFQITECFSGSDGTRKWSYRKNLPSNYDPEVTDNFVFTGDLTTDGNDGNIHCLNKTTGDLVWKKNIGQRVNHITYYDNKLYVGTRDFINGKFEGKLLCLDVGTQDTLWTYDATDSEANSAGGVPGKPVIYDHKVFFSTLNKKVICASADSGKIVWTLNATNGFWAGVTIDTTNNRGYGVANSDYYCFDLATGQVIWFKDEFGSVFQPPILYNGVVYTVALGGVLKAHNADTGDLLYRSLDEDGETPLEGDFIITQGKILILGLKYIYALKPL